MLEELFRKKTEGYGTLSPGFIRKHIEERNIQPLTKGAFLAELERQKYPPELITAFDNVDRGHFVPKGVPSDYVYAECSWPLSELGYGRTTISEPLVVAEMTKLLSPQLGENILEVGTGSGYQAAILTKLVGSKGTVITTEIDKNAAQFAREHLKNAGIANVKVVQTGDKDIGCQKKSPFDKILVTCSTPPIKDHPLFTQLANGGKLVAPFGVVTDPNVCILIAIDKDVRGKLKGTVGYEGQGYQSYGFVLMLGQHGWEGVNPNTSLDEMEKFLRALELI